MKHLVLGIAVLFLALGSMGCSFWECEEESEFPRYQILSEGHMKFDTQTGKTWVRQGNQWLLMTEAEQEKEKASSHDELSTCEYMVNMDIRLGDIRKSEAFSQLPTREKMRVFQAYFTHHKLWRDDMKDAKKLRDLHAAIREELSID